jgi:hypothetical protein
MKYTSTYAVKCGSNFKLYIFDVTESEVNQFRVFLHRFAFPVFSIRFFDRFFHLQHIDLTENIYRILIKQTGHLIVLYCMRALNRFTISG